MDDSPTAWEASLIEALHTHRYSDALRILEQQEEQALMSKSWDLITLCLHSVDEYTQSKAKRLDETLLETNDVPSPANDADNEQVIDEVLLKLAEYMKPKELIMIYLTAVTRIKTTCVFERIVKSVTDCLAAAREPNMAMIQWGLKVLADTLKTLPAPPEDQPDSAEERTSMDSRKEVRTINERYRLVMDFVEDSLRLVSENCRDRLRGTSALQIGSRILAPLESTLGLLNLSPPHEQVSPSVQYSLATRLKKTLNTIVASPVALLQLSECIRAKYDDDELVLPSVSGAVFCYIVFCLDDDFPRVYSARVLADLLLHFSLVLVSSTKHMHIVKGLSLIKSALPYVGVCAESEDELTIRRLLRSLLQVMTTCTLQEARDSSMPCWRELYSRCSLDFQLEIVRSLFKSLEDASVRGFLIDEWRKLAYKSQRPEHCQDLVETVVYLPDGVTTDLIKHSEHILSALNVLRFGLATRSFVRTSHVEQYLTNLKKALEISRAHYKLQLETPPSERQHISLLPNVPLDMEKDMLSHALTRFDLIEFVLASVQNSFDTNNVS